MQPATRLQLCEQPCSGACVGPSVKHRSGSVPKSLLHASHPAPRLSLGCAACSVLVKIASALHQAPEADQAAFRATLGALGPEQLCALVRRVQQHITIEAYEEPLDPDTVRPGLMHGRSAAPRRAAP